MWQQHNGDVAWDQAAAQLNLRVQQQQNGWGVWQSEPVIPAGFTGTNMREVTGYDGPSMMDGVLPENNAQGDSAALWNEHILRMEQAAEDIMNGVISGGFRFIQAGGRVSRIRVPLSMATIWFFAKVYSVVSTPRLDSGVRDSFNMF